MVLALVFFIVFGLVYFLLKIFVYPPTPNSISYSDNNFYVLSLSIPAHLDFCGEKIPSNDYDIKEALEKEFFSSAYWKSNSVTLFHKTQKWFPYIEPILKQEGVPDDFKYLAFIESHMSNATSPAGAAGFWQLVPVSARNYGLVVNDEVDERYHVEKATHAACRHIKDAYNIFKNWTLAAAAYNLGIGGVQRQLKKQNTDNYFDLLLNAETGSFVYRILAYKTLFSSPGHFGIKKKKRAYFSKIPFNVFKVDTAINNLTAFAKHLGSDRATVRLFNPWILKDVIQNTDKHVFEIVVPKNPDADYTSYLDDLARKGNSGMLFNKAGLAELTATDVIVPPVEPVKADTIPALVLTKKSVYHVAKADELLKNIAAQYHVKPEELRKWNNLGETETAEKGQVLVIYYFVPKEK